MARTREEIIEIITKLIAEQINKDRSAISLESSLESLGADSLDQVEIIIKLQEEFGVEIDDNSAEALRTVGQAVDYICNIIS